MKINKNGVWVDIGPRPRDCFDDEFTDFRKTGVLNGSHYTPMSQAEKRKANKRKYLQALEDRQQRRQQQQQQEGE